ncbi:hypothetical protein LCGC14_0594370 [marine sediment metagenome]|uniref:10 kDa chaperonin n=1 Tax=marine sediment metagenome TaxID=412755 RepID=A0A0F9RCI1_9ZZZZ
MDLKQQKKMAKQVGLITRTCEHRSQCIVLCVAGGPVPRVLECVYWADHLKKEASSIERRKNPTIIYEFNLGENKMANPKVGLTKNRVPMPLGDIIVVKPHVEEVSSGGILLVPQHVEKGMKKSNDPRHQVCQGEVLACGPGVFTDTGAQIPIPLEAGDMIIYMSAGIIGYDLDGEKYHLITVAGLLARLEDGPFTNSE